MDKKPVSEKQKEAYDRLLATHPDVERKGKNLLYTSVNGHMFTVGQATCIGAPTEAA